MSKCGLNIESMSEKVPDAIPEGKTMWFHQHGSFFQPFRVTERKSTTPQTQETLMALPGSAISQACFIARISSARSVSFFTSRYSASLCSVTTLKIQ